MRRGCGQALWQRQWRSPAWDCNDCMQSTFRYTHGQQRAASRVGLTFRVRLED